MVVGSPRFIGLWYLLFSLHYFFPSYCDGSCAYCLWWSSALSRPLPSELVLHKQEKFSRDASWHDPMRWCWENFWFKWCWWEKFESNRIVDVNLWCWWENFEPNPIKIKFIRRKRVHGVISPSFQPFGKLSKQWNGWSQFFLLPYCSFSLRLWYAFSAPRIAIN